MSNKSAIIFGVTGQDGSYLSEYLLSMDYKVVGVTRRCSVDNTVNIKGVLSNPDFLLLEGDVSDYLSVSGAFNQAKTFCGGQPREVYNLAAQSHVGLSFSQPTAAFRMNAEGPLNVLSAIKAEGDPSLTRFYQASTSEMFGNTPGPQNEESTLAPNSPYAIAKLAGHHTVRMFREAYGMYACAGILFNHESPRRGEKFVTRKICKYVASLWHILNCGRPQYEVGTAKLICIMEYETNRPIMIPTLKLGNLDACRDWGYAPDYVRGMHMMLSQDIPKDYVVGTGETHTIRDFLDYAFGCVGISDWRYYVEVDQEFVRPLDVNYLLADPTKARHELGWSPQVSFKELVEIMLKAELDEIHCN